MKTIISSALLTLSLAHADIYATFNVKPLKEATLAFTQGGTVETITVDVGAKVRKGALLAHLESTQEEANVRLAQNDLENAKIIATQNDNSYQRYVKVKDIMDAEKFEKITFAKQTSEVNVKKAQNILTLRRTQLNEKSLKAPFDGVITQKFKEVGDAVAGVQPQAFFQIMDLDSVKLLITFDEKYAQKVKVGDSFYYRLDGSQTEQEGKISKIYPSVDSKTRKIQAEVITQGLLPGIFGAGYIKAD